MTDRAYQADVVIAGGGLAGLVTAHELLGHGKKVLLLDRDTEENLGGLAKESFGGVHLIGTPHQKKSGIRDSPELAWKDWESCAHFESTDAWPRRWARFYCENSLEHIYHFMNERKIEFLPVVNWAERGVFGGGNSVPRWHITWGTGFEIIFRMRAALEAHPRRKNLQIHFQHEVSGIELTQGRATRLTGRSLPSGEGFSASGEHLVIASGGICGGD